MSTQPSAVILGAGPGLGMSIAHRFGREGYSVALVSRSATRHAGYLSALEAEGITAAAYTADIHDKDALRAVLDQITERFGPTELLYFGPATASMPGPILETDPAAVAEVMNLVYSAIEAAHQVVPGMVERGSGGLLFGGGLSAVQPMPALGALTVTSAALRNYVVNLHAGLEGTGVYAGILTIGGLIERGDIHQLVTAMPELDVAGHTLNPDVIADGAWKLFSVRDSAEEIFSA